MSRTKKTAKNTIVGLAFTGVSYILSFVLRAVFIRLLGLEYSGINSLFTDILKVLNLADLGFNNAILFKLYKTIAAGDDDATEMYLTLYRKICYVVGAIIGIVGLCFIPFLENFVRETPSFPEPLWSLYTIILATSVSSHFINYKSILLIAKQDRYISIVIQYICIILKNGLQIVVLLLYKNIYLYLLVGLASTIIEGVLLGTITYKKYRLSWHSKATVPRNEIEDITKDVGALAIFKFCRTLNVTIDTFLITKFIDVGQTAIYGSLTIITSGLSNFIDTLNDGMIASIGDLNASGDKDGVEHVLEMSIHTMYLLYGTCTAVLVPFISPFMKWWIGYTLPESCVYVLLFNFFTGGINANVSTFRNSMGLYRKGWKRPAATVVVNCIASYCMITNIGIIGAFIGTMIANVTTVLWYDPLIVYKYGLKKSSKRFFCRYVIYLLLVFFASVLLLLFRKFLPEANSFISLVWHGIIYMCITMSILLIGGSMIPAQKSLINRFISITQRK